MPLRLNLKLHCMQTFWTIFEQVGILYVILQFLFSVPFVHFIGSGEKNTTSLNLAD